MKTIFAAAGIWQQRGSAGGGEQRIRVDHIFATAAGEEGRTDRHRLATFPLSLSLSPLHTHITRTHTHRFPSSSHLIGGGLEEAGATIAADGELKRSSLFFPLKATFPTLLSSLPSRWCSACEKSVGYQMTRCKSITRSRIWRGASSAHYFCIYLDSVDHQTRISAAYHTASSVGRVKAVCRPAVWMAASALVAVYALHCCCRCRPVRTCRPQSAERIIWCLAEMLADESPRCTTLQGFLY